MKIQAVEDTRFRNQLSLLRSEETGKGDGQSIWPPGVSYLDCLELEAFAVHVAFGIETDYSGCVGPAILGRPSVRLAEVFQPGVVTVGAVTL